MIDLNALKAPFPAEAVSWRVGSTNSDKTKGLALAYIDARDVMERLDAVCGLENWQDRYEFHGTRTVCYLSIRIGDEWVTKADGAGDSDVESEKGSISDALKRAAVKWSVGRYLYDVASPWVELEAKGRSHVIRADQFGRLTRALNDAAKGIRSAPEAEPSPKAQEPAPERKPVQQGSLAERASASQRQQNATPKVSSGLPKQTLASKEAGIEAALLMSIDTAETVADLNNWAESTENVNALSQLDEAGKARVRERWASVRKTLLASRAA